MASDHSLSNISEPSKHGTLDSNFTDGTSSRSISTGSDLVLVNNKNMIRKERMLLINELRKNQNNSNLTRQFFTLGLLEYMCNMLSPSDSVQSQQKFKGQ